MKKLKKKLKIIVWKNIGCEYTFQRKDVRDKIADTCMNIWGVDNPSKSNEIKNKISFKLKNRSELDKNKSNIKRRKTKKQIYNDEYYGLFSIDKIIPYNQEKYGCDYYTQTEEFKKHMSMISQNRSEEEKLEIIRKTIENNQKKWHYDWPSQSPDIDCSCHRFQYDGHNFDSNWEYLYYKYLKENNIEFTYKPNISFEYEYDGKIHYYKPDFIVNGIITEVKGDHFFKDGKMICPWKHKNDTPEKIEWRNGLFEAKHQCMIKNGITILKYKELHDIGII